MFDPFDFSDFGSPQPTAGPTTLRPPQPDPNLDTGFDPFTDTQPARGKSDDVFSGTTSGTSGPAESLDVARPPLALFGLAMALAAAGAVIAGVWGGSLAAAALGWFAAGPAAIGVLAVYTLVDTRRRTNAVYSAPTWTGALYWTVVAACLIGISIGAWNLALWAGRR